MLYTGVFDVKVCATDYCIIDRGCLQREDAVPRQFSGIVQCLQAATSDGGPSPELPPLFTFHEYSPLYYFSVVLGIKPLSK